MNIRHVLAASAMAGALLAAGAVPAFAASPNAANMENFVDQPIPSCDGPFAGTGTPSASFAIIKDSPSGVVSAEISLKNAAPDSTYSAFIQTNPNCQFSTTAVALITTNGQGNGNGSLSFNDPTGTQALVYVYQDNGGDYMQTPLYTFGSK